MLQQERNKIAATSRGRQKSSNGKKASQEKESKKDVSSQTEENKQPTSPPKGVGPRSHIMNWKTYYMCLAIVAAHRSPMNITRVGCVYVSGKKVIGIGWNGSISGSTLDILKHEDVIHAEVNGIFYCSDTDKLEGATLYVTHYPCHLCARVIAINKIAKVVYLVIQKNPNSRYQSTQEILEHNGVKIEPFGIHYATLATFFKNTPNNYFRELKCWEDSIDKTPIEPEEAEFALQLTTQMDIKDTKTKRKSDIGDEITKEIALKKMEIELLQKRLELETLKQRIQQQEDESS
jgi:dCMP deaminase